MNTAAKLSTGPSRTCARDKDVKKDGDGVSKTNGSLRSRARACEGFYDPAIEDDADAATDYAMKQTGCKTGPCRPQDGGPLQKNLQNAFRPMPRGLETRFCVLKTFRFCGFHSVGKVEGRD